MGGDCSLGEGVAMEMAVHPIVHPCYLYPPLLRPSSLPAQTITAAFEFFIYTPQSCSCQIDSENYYLVTHPELQL